MQYLLVIFLVGCGSNIGSKWELFDPDSGVTTVTDSAILDEGVEDSNISIIKSNDAGDLDYEDDRDISIEDASMNPLFEKIIDFIPPPAGDPNEVLQLQVNTIDYSPYLGKLGIGKVVNGTININQNIVVAKRDGSLAPVRIAKIFKFELDEKNQTILSRKRGEAMTVRLITPGGFTLSQTNECSYG